MMAYETAPAVWVGCLAAYNHGKLHGRWIDADADAEDIAIEIAAVLATSPIPRAEEPFIADHESDADGGPASEHPDAIAAWGAFLSEHGPAGGAALDYNGGNLEHAESLMEGYRGLWDDMKAYADDYAETMGWFDAVPPGYLDVAAVARDLDTELISVAYGAQIHIFDPRCS